MAAQCLLHLGLVICLNVPVAIPNELMNFAGGDPCQAAMDGVNHAQDIAMKATTETADCVNDPDKCVVKTADTGRAAEAMKTAVAELYKACAAQPGKPGGPHATFGLPAG
jgi:hypothetical protein